MRFEYDAAKSAANLARHGMDFVTVQELWAGFTLSAPAKDVDEPRMLVVGMIAGRHWTAIVTRRGEFTRIISARGSRDSEKAAYEKALQ